jgi:serine/threonine protein kinase
MKDFEKGARGLFFLRKENIMELCIAGDDLQGVLTSIKTHKTYRGYTRLDVFDMVADATIHVLSDLNDKNIHHCDIKLDNLMFCQDKSDANIMTARVIDFGESSSRCMGGSPLFVPNHLTRNQVIYLFRYHFSTDLTWIPATQTGHAGKPYSIYENPAYADKYALAITLAIILGDLGSGSNDPRMQLCMKLMNDTIDWKEAKVLVNNFPKSPDSKLLGGAVSTHKRKAKPIPPPEKPKWVSTGRKVTIQKRGSPAAQKTVFRNSVTKELRVRKATLSKDGTRRFAYVKF